LHWLLAPLSGVDGTAEEGQMVSCASALEAQALNKNREALIHFRMGMWFSIYFV
jgi:hypothetical protein